MGSAPDANVKAGDVPADARAEAGALSTVLAEIEVTGPCVIGATGGSGTRAVAGIVRDGGMFIGQELNFANDAIAFGAYSDRWINVYLRARDQLPAEAARDMAEDLACVVDVHCESLPRDARCWGWKEPRSIYLLPFFHSCMPDLRFLHVVRDGRDMAFSRNQQQLMKHGSAALERLPSWRRTVRSIALWNRVNLAAADYGERCLGDRYMVVRFEDLCADPAGVIEAVYAFFGLDGDPSAAAAEVKPPEGIGRWRGRRKGLVKTLERQAGPALRRFGYL
jgi:Sulfotransferase family